MALGDIWELRLNSTVFNQTIYNVFHFEETTAETVNQPEIALAEAFYEDIVPSLQPLMDGSMWVAAADVKQLTGGSAIHTKALTAAGSVVGECLNRFYAYGFRYNRASSSGRHGYKRFGAVPETAVADGQITGTFITAANTLAAALFTPIQWNGSSGDGFFTPRILSKYSGGQKRVTPVAQPIASIVFVGFTTQNTRK